MPGPALRRGRMQGMNAPHETEILETGAGLAGLGAPHVVVVPTDPLPDPYWVAWNAALAQALGLPAQPDQGWLHRLSGHGAESPWCSAYAGHQFGVWAGPLGDGRAHTLGLLTLAGQSQEIQLKGAGRTPFSRMGDGRAVLRSSIREYLASEALAGLGIPTTRALAVTGSTLPVQRETLETAAIVTRVAPSFIRFGHFEHFAHHGHHDALQRLTDHVIARFYPECAQAPVPAQALLAAVAQRTAHLMARWQAVGFCHGVMNTDNMSILGLTLDYGPFGFMDGFDFHHVCNHSDSHGRYAYDQQPRIGWWNCAALGSALMPLIGDEDAVREALDGYAPAFQAALADAFRAKLGLAVPMEDDYRLASGLLTLLHESHADYTGFFRALCGLRRDAPESDGPLRDRLLERDAFDRWARDYRARLAAEHSRDEERAQAMRRVNPKYVLRNYLAEQAIRDARDGRFDTLETLARVLSAPFDEHPGQEAWAGEPPDWAGTLSVSCSS
ncbi:MAG: YdiU family protein [Betaproteobacteria bacterium]|nr:YdiU family protein [Betaproteobacteria bacterium]